MNVLNKQLTLSLNRHWQPVGLRTVKQAFVALCSQSNDEHAALALDIEMAKDENGEDVLVYANPVSWEQWITLPVRSQDLYVQCSRDRKIRVPTVIVSVHYDKVPLRRPRFSAKAIWERDGGVCQYTGEKVTRANGNLDHVVPRDRGGRDSFENLVVARADLNSRKGNRLNHEIGYTLIRKPKAPPSIPISASIQEVNHDTWRPFLIGR